MLCLSTSPSTGYDDCLLSFHRSRMLVLEMSMCWWSLFECTFLYDFYLSALFFWWRLSDDLLGQWTHVVRGGEEHINSRTASGHVEWWGLKREREEKRWEVDGPPHQKSTEEKAVWKTVMKKWTLIWRNDFFMYVFTCCVILKLFFCLAVQVNVCYGWLFINFISNTIITVENSTRLPLRILREGRDAYGRTSLREPMNGFSWIFSICLMVTMREFLEDWCFFMRLVLPKEVQFWKENDNDRSDRYHKNVDENEIGCKNILEDALGNFSDF